MKHAGQISLFLLFSGILTAQTQPFRENNRWGIREKEQILVPAAYDTIFRFDPTGQVCVACFRTRTASASKFIKVQTTSYVCHYLNKKNERLRLRIPGNDTCSLFNFTKSTLKQYDDSSQVFVVSVKPYRYLLRKDFKQLTFTGYHDICLSPDPGFYITQMVNEAEVTVTGLIDVREKEVIPYRYSGLRFNTEDSLIIACSAIIRNNAEDEVFDYSGKKVTGHRRHIDMATKNFMIHKLYEPKERYILHNISSKEEKELSADEVRSYKDDQILFRVRDDWFLYDLVKNEKRTFK